MSSSDKNNKQGEFFTSKTVPAKQGSGKLFDEELTVKNKPVECLGMTFENDEKRREYFTELLRDKLKDPDFRKIEGFPIGEDEDILNLSDPPYYTACPNPWIPDFIKLWESQKPKGDGKPYHREPFAADVSEGKNDPIYNAHSYHTKVPHKAIMRYILHYTEPGDIVFDGFCGTGMTGVAAQMCGDRATVQSLGYQVLEDGTIMQEETDETGKKIWTKFSKLGARKAVLNDLSPAATFIAYNYNTPVDVEEFEREAKRILKEVEEECGWMYETKHTDGRVGRILYTVWSDVFVCRECSGEIVLWETAVNRKTGKVEDDFSCPHCSAQLTKRIIDRASETRFDAKLDRSIIVAKRIPVLIVYEVNGVKGRFTKAADSNDLALLMKVERGKIPNWFPINRMIEGRESRRNDKSGVTHVHHFYTKRNCWTLAVLAAKIATSRLRHILQYQLDSLVIRQSKLSRLLVSYFFHGGGGWVGGPISGTLYIPSFSIEVQPFDTWSNRIKKTSKTANSAVGSTAICTGHASSTLLPCNMLDYFFFDPPFGGNLQYSQLNYLWESWLKVWTNCLPEAIESPTQGKSLAEYRLLMTQAFKEAYRLLKKGRWMTVEFSNTKASIWNSIQTALTEAGFIVANISALDKKQGSFKAVTTATAVKQDLVISAYKPNGGFEDRFAQEAKSEKGVWDFTRTHMKYLPVAKVRNGTLIQIPERDPRILYDQVVSYYVRKGYSVPLSSPEFQQGLSERFILRDGMYFLPQQAVEYDKKRSRVMKTVQLTLFVSDEASAIQWLKQQLQQKPQTYQSIHPDFMQELKGWSKNEKELELSELLAQNFIQYDGLGAVPNQIHSYLSSNYKELRNLTKDDPALKEKAKDRWYVPDPKKAEDIEKVRERALLKEFKEYVEFRKKKLKIFRLEAVRAGFKKAWQERDYTTIIAVAEKIPEKVLQEDPKLLMWYDQAVTRSALGSKIPT